MAREYDEEYKKEAVRSYFNSGEGKKAFAKQLGVPSSTFRSWVDLYRNELEPAPKNLEEENARLRRQLKEMTEERDFLKEVSAFFAKQRK